jgi:hypothetical protein
MEEVQTKVIENILNGIIRENFPKLDKETFIQVQDR